MSDIKLIQVFFLKSPTGAPWFLAYNKGEYGFVRRQKAEAMEAAGVIKPLSLPAQSIRAEEFTPAAALEEKQAKKNDMATADGVRAELGETLETLQLYCTKHGIKYAANAKRPEYYWSRIAKHNSK